jgi:hypothetical protein
MTIKWEKEPSCPQMLLGTGIYPYSKDLVGPLPQAKYKG